MLQSNHSECLAALPVAAMPDSSPHLPAASHLEPDPVFGQ